MGLEARRSSQMIWKSIARLVRACFENRSAKGLRARRGGWRGGTRAHIREKSLTDEQRSQPPCPDARPPETFSKHALRYSLLFALLFVVLFSDDLRNSSVCWICPVVSKIVELCAKPQPQRMIFSCLGISFIILLATNARLSQVTPERSFSQRRFQMVFFCYTYRWLSIWYVNHWSRLCSEFLNAALNTIGCLSHRTSCGGIS